MASPYDENYEDSERVSFLVWMSREGQSKIAGEALQSISGEIGKASLEKLETLKDSSFEEFFPELAEQLSGETLQLAKALHGGLRKTARASMISPGNYRNLGDISFDAGGPGVHVHGETKRLLPIRALNSLLQELQYHFSLPFINYQWTSVHTIGPENGSEIGGGAVILIPGQKPTVFRVEDWVRKQSEAYVIDHHGNDNTAYAAYLVLPGDKEPTAYFFREFVFDDEYACFNQERGYHSCKPEAVRDARAASPAEYRDMHWQLASEHAEKEKPHTLISINDRYTQEDMAFFASESRWPSVPELLDHIDWLLPARDEDEAQTAAHAMA